MKRYFFLVIILLTFPLFFYKLGQTSLTSWDEAWYAEIARNILIKGNPINLIWNNAPFFDHPPLGFWLMALTFKIFKINEFWTRFPSALSGIISIALLYLLGKKLFNPLVGISSAIALSSAIWFIFRSRSGNLDIILTMFFLLTLLLAIMAAKQKRYLLFFSLSLSFLFLAKTMVPLAILPPVIVIFYKNKSYKLRELLIPTLIFLIIAGGWFASQIIQFPSFIPNYLGVGLRGTSLDTNYLANLNLVKEYLHSGIGRWFWPSILSLILSIFLMQKRFLILIVFLISFILPITFSPKIQIWHLIPLFPILILSYFGFTYVILEKLFTNWRHAIYCIILVFSALIYLNQIRVIWYQFIDIPAFVSDEAILSIEAANYPQDYIVDGEYRPAALFYSGKGKISQAPKNQEDFVNLLKSQDEFLMITNKWRLEDPNISSADYKFLKEDRDKVLILHNN